MAKLINLRHAKPRRSLKNQKIDRPSRAETENAVRTLIRWASSCIVSKRIEDEDRMPATTIVAGVIVMSLDIPSARTNHHDGAFGRQLKMRICRHKC